MLRTRAGGCFVAADYREREVFEAQKRDRRLTQKLNTIDRPDFEGIAAIVRDLLGQGEDVFIYPPFYCDYGDRIEIGK